MGLSEDVSYITLCKPLPLVLHGYVWPFALVYVSLVSVWIGGVYGLDESPEVFYLCLAAIAAINIITCLCCVWSVHIRCALTCKQARAIIIPYVTHHVHTFFLKCHNFSMYD